MTRSSLILVFVLAVAATACGLGRQPNYYSINADGSRSETYSRINEWTSYGTSALGAQSAIAAAYEQAQHAPPPANQVEIYNASLPPGVTLEHGTVKIDKDAPYVAVGRFEIGYWKDSAPREAAIEPDLRRLAHVAQGNTIVVEVQRFDHADDRVSYMSGLVLQRRVLLTGDSSAAAAPAQPTVGGFAPRRSRAQARLVYQATGAGCMTEDELADEVSAKLGYSPWQASAPPVRIAIRGDQDGYHATVSLPDRAPKSLRGDSCKAVIDAAVTVVVIAFDDRASTAAPARATKAN